MHKFILLAFALAACKPTDTAAPPSSAAPTPVAPHHVPSSPALPRAAELGTVVPGKSIGPIELGMTRDQVAGLGLPNAPGFNERERVRKVGPYTVGFDEHFVVRSIDLALLDAPRGVDVGGVNIPHDATLEQAAKLLTCGPEIPATGANKYECNDKQIVLVQGSAEGARVPVEIQVRAK